MAEQETPKLYEPLPPNHLRILQLEGFHHVHAASRTSPVEVLVARLKTISLDELNSRNELYIALSYCWKTNPVFIEEKDAEKHIIQCNGQVVRLQPNLWSALWYFAKQKGGPRTIWADALCINQFDANEKTQQVAIMGDIYKGVGCVVVWLGPQGHRVKELFAALSNYVGSGSPNIHPRWELKPADGGGTRLDHMKIQIGLTFVRYCDWLDRVWTFQEIFLARHAVVRAGNEQINWKTLDLGWEFLTRARFDDHKHVRDKIRFIDTARHDTSSLLHLLRTVWNRQATDKRDKVYAVLGMYEGKATMKPDYRLTVRQAMVRITQAAVEESKSLDALHFAGFKYLPTWWSNNCYAGCLQGSHVDNGDLTGRCHLPSWVPDWGESARSDSIAKRDLESLQKLEFPDLDRNFVFDYRWNGENIVAAGFALGRLAQDQGSGVIVPFPECAFKRHTDDDARWGFSRNLGKMLALEPPVNGASKANIAEFAHNVKLHDEGKCPCSGVIDRPPRTTLGNHGASQYHKRSFFTVDYSRVEHLDWVVILFGTRSAMYLRADCQVQPNPWEDDHSDKYRIFRAPTPSLAEQQPLGTFVLTYIKDDDECGNLLDPFDIHGELTRELKYLGDLSFVYGDFELR